MLLTNRNLDTAGREMYSLATELFPICRSMTGPGVRETLERLSQHVSLQTHEVPTGTRVFDWEVPREWRIDDAYIKDSHGTRMVDFRNSNLHVVNGSSPIHRTMSWPELKGHLHTLPEQPDLIPYRTCFHREEWGFCLSHAEYQRLDANGELEYDVCIDSSLAAGFLTYGEVSIPGELDDEVLLTTHICHPSLANDNLSGIVITTYLAKWLSEVRRHYSYRLLFLPATIGAITWLSRNEQRIDNIKHGLILTLLGDAGGWTYKKCRRDRAEINRVVAHLMAQSGDEFTIREFEPFGYDERQFCSPGIDLPTGCLMRSANGEFPEYHTSADNLDFISSANLARSLEMCIEIVEVLEGNQTYLNQSPKCEPRLDQHGLYEAFGCGEEQVRLQQAVLWVLNLSDGLHSLMDIAERSSQSFAEIRSAATALCDCGLLKEHRPASHRADSLSDAGHDRNPNPRRAPNSLEGMI